MCILVHGRNAGILILTSLVLGHRYGYDCRPSLSFVLDYFLSWIAMSIMISCPLARLK